MKKLYPFLAILLLAACSLPSDDDEPAATTKPPDPLPICGTPLLPPVEEPTEASTEGEGMKASESNEPEEVTKPAGMAGETTTLVIEENYLRR